MYYQIRIRAKDATRRIRRAGFWNGYHNKPRHVKGRFDGQVTRRFTPDELKTAVDALGRDLDDANIEVWGPFNTDPTKRRKKK